MASAQLFDFLTCVDEDKGVKREEPFVIEVIALLKKNGITMPFELADFDPKQCVEGELGVLHASTMGFSYLPGAVPVGVAMCGCLSLRAREVSFIRAC